MRSKITNKSSRFNKFNSRGGGLNLHHLNRAIQNVASKIATEGGIPNPLTDAQRYSQGGTISSTLQSDIPQNSRARVIKQGDGFYYKR